MHRLPLGHSHWPCWVESLFQDHGVLTETAFFTSFQPSLTAPRAAYKDRQTKTRRRNIKKRIKVIQGKRVQEYVLKDDWERPFWHPCGCCVKGSRSIIDFSLLGVRELPGALENLALPLLMVWGGAIWGGCPCTSRCPRRRAALG